LEERYAVRGEHAYDPRMLLKLWLYGVTQGVYSGRELARRVRRDLAFRYLAGDGPVLDFRTMNRCRMRHREDFAAVLRETVRLAQGAGLVRLGLVAIDGTKLRANTSRSKALSHQRMRETEARLEAEIAAVMQRLDEVNAAELQDRQRRLAKLQAVRVQLEREKGEGLKPKDQKSLVDPEANMMRVGNDGALTYADNAQAATSEDGHGRPDDDRARYPAGATDGRGRHDDDGRGAGRCGAGQGLSERGESGGAAGAGAALSDRGGPRRERGALAAGRRDAAHASAAVGAPPVCEAEDAGGAALCGDQTGDAIPALPAARAGEGVGRVELGGRRVKLCRLFALEVVLA
jgi:Transposase domain (DUF772)